MMLIPTALMLLVLVQSAAGACPSTVCKADFSNALGGPVDCCKWDYNKGKCVWGGTPVSWNLQRTCTEGGKTFAVLVSNNFQGPPGGSPECRCNNPQATQPSVLQACITLKPRVDMDITGSDIPCKSNNFCQICGSPEDVKNACMQDNRCVAFSYEPSTSCGYLKAAPLFKERKGWVTYARD